MGVHRDHADGLIDMSAKTKSESAAARKADPTVAQRKFKRRDLRVSVSVRAENGKTITGTSSDLSLGGLRLIAPDVLELKDKGTARISNGSRPVVNVDFEVVWKQPAEGGDAKYGLRFAPLTEPQRFSLLDHIYGLNREISASPPNGSS